MEDGESGAKRLWNGYIRENGHLFDMFLSLVLSFFKCLLMILFTCLYLFTFVSYLFTFV